MSNHRFSSYHESEYDHKRKYSHTGYKHDTPSESISIIKSEIKYHHHGQEHSYSHRSECDGQETPTAEITLDEPNIFKALISSHTRVPRVAQAMKEDTSASKPKESPIRLLASWIQNDEAIKGTQVKQIDGFDQNTAESVSPSPPARCKEDWLYHTPVIFVEDGAKMTAAMRKIQHSLKESSTQLLENMAARSRLENQIELRNHFIGKLMYSILMSQSKICAMNAILEKLKEES